MNVKRKKKKQYPRKCSEINKCSHNKKKKKKKKHTEGERDEGRIQREIVND